MIFLRPLRELFHCSQMQIVLRPLPSTLLIVSHVCLQSSLYSWNLSLKYFFRAALTRRVYTALYSLNLDLVSWKGIQYSSNTFYIAQLDIHPIHSTLVSQIFILYILHWSVRYSSDTFYIVKSDIHPIHSTLVSWIFILYILDWSVRYSSCTFYLGQLDIHPIHSTLVSQIFILYILYWSVRYSFYTFYIGQLDIHPVHSILVS